jgi:LacI family transcriptional regulator
VASVTIRDVAKQANVGVGTVSRVLNDHPSVSEATRQKVLTAINDLNYNPNPIARRLSLGKTLAVAVIVPFFTRPAFVERLRGVEYALAESEYDLILFNVETTARRDACYDEVLRRERIDGLLLISLSPSNADADHFLRTQVPTVLLDAYHPYFNRVVIEDVTGGFLATQHLLALGHRKIGFVSDRLDNPFNFVSSRSRYQGYTQALAQANLPVLTEYQCQGDYGRPQARSMAHKLLALPDPPTAIFAVSDTQAIGVLEAAQDLGLTVPQDLSVVGYDDIEMAEYLRLTTIRQPFFVSGLEAVNLLLDSMDRSSPTPVEIVLPVELIERSTTAPPRS